MRDSKCELPHKRDSIFGPSELDRTGKFFSAIFSKHSTSSLCRRRATNISDKTKRGQEPLAALVRSEIARWAPIIKAADFKGE